MCTRPLRIFNPTKSFSYRDKLYLEVPCGKCKQCRNRKIDDYGVRAYFEGLYTKNIGGRVFFCTGTYDDNHIPKYFDEEGNLHYGFDKHDIQCFLKLLRKRFPSRTIRYFLTCEFGKGTNRPHIHMILYCLFPIDERDIFTFLMDVKEVWQGVRSWEIKGNERGLKRGLFQIEELVSFRGYFYVSKYISKQFNYDFSKLPSGCLPFHLQSIGFGSYIMDYFGFTNKRDTCKNMQMILSGKIVLPNGDVKCLPQYISRKLLYDYEYQRSVEIFESDLQRTKYQVKFNLNDFGRYIRSQRCCLSIDTIYQEVIDKFNPTILLTLNIKQLNEYLHSSFADNQQLYSFVKDCLPNASSVSDFALYLSTFKDRVIIPFGVDNVFSPFGTETVTVDNFKTPSKTDAYEYIRTIFGEDLETFDFNDISLSRNLSHVYHKNRSYIDVVSSSMFNHVFPYYYDLLSNLLNYILYVHTKDSEEKYVQKEIFYDMAKNINPNSII